MNDALWLDPSITTRVCLTLLHSLWLIPLLAAIAGLAEQLLRLSVERSYTLHVTTLIAVLAALPVIYANVDVASRTRSEESHATSANRVPVTDVEAAARAVAPHEPIDEPDHSTLTAAAAHFSPSAATRSNGFRPIVDWRHATIWITSLYALGVLAMLLRLARGLWSAHHDTAHATGLQSGPLVAQLAVLTRQCSLRIAPMLATTERIVVPQVVGLFRPMILLPASALSGLAPDELRMILAHELAHIRRHDLWVNLVQRVAETVLFFNPALWWLTRRTSTLREFCCDEFACRVLSSGAPRLRSEYAAALLRVAELSRPFAGAAGELATLGAAGRSPSELRRRIARLLGEPVHEPLRLSPGGLAIVAAVLALTLAGSALWPNVDSAFAQQARSSAPVQVDDAANPSAESTDTSDPALMEISGACTTDDGKPIQDAEVRLYHRALPSLEVTLLQTARTDERGRYEFKNVRRPSVTQRQTGSEPYALAVKANGRASEIHFVSTRFGPSVTQNFSLKRAATLEGRVTGLGLQPLASADVWIQGLGLGPLEGVLSGKTDADGHFAIPDAKPWKSGDDDIVLPNGGISISAMYFRIFHPDYGIQLGQFTRVPDTVGLNVAPGGIVEGRVVVTETGRPAAGVLVRACSQTGETTGSDFVRTDEEGRYRFVLPESTYNVWAHHEELTVEAITGLSVKSGVTQTAPDLRLIEGGLIEGQLIDADSGEPVSLRDDDVVHITIDGPARPTSSGAVQVEPIQSDGSFRFRLPPGPNRLSLPHRSYGSFDLQNDDKSTGGRVIVNVTDGQTVKVAMKVRRVVRDDRRQAASETGRRPKENRPNNETPVRPQFELLVVDPAGRPVPRASVELRFGPHAVEDDILVGDFDRPATYGPFVKTDDTGRLVFRRPESPERFNISIKTPGYGPYWAGWNSDQHPQAIPERFTAELEAGWSVGGVVVDEDGKPIEGVDVRPSVSYKKRPGDDDQLGVGTRITTDADGRWRFDSVPVSKSDVWVEVNHSEFQPNRRRLSRDEFGLALDQQPSARIALDRGLTVRGRVADDQGQPIVDALVRTKFMNDIREARTDADGNYTLIGCEARMARIVVSATGRATDMQQVRVDEGLAPVNFVMQPGGHVRIRVVDEQGQGIPRARIFFQRWRGMLDYFEFDHVGQYADENGVWEWNEAPLDEFQADICRPDGMQLSQRSLIARDEEYVFAPPRALVVSGQVVDAQTSRPVERFRVIPGYRSDEPQPRTHWMTNDSYEATDGRYELRITREEPSFFLRIEAEGFEVAVSRDIKFDEGQIAVDFALQPAADFAATIVTAEGDPAGGAKVALGVAGSQISLRNGDFFDISTYATRFDADADGNIRFPMRTEPFQLVIVHPSGFAWLKSDEQAIPSVVRLTPWARVEGVFRAGPKPVPNVRLQLDTQMLQSWGQGQARVHSAYEVTTSSDGSYVFDRVTPGPAGIGRAITLMVKDGATEVTSRVPARIDLPAGKTTRLEIGGDGRAVTGSLIPPTDFQGRVLWNFALVTAHTDVGEFADPEPPEDVKNDEQKLAQWRMDWTRSPAGQAWWKEYAAYQERLGEALHMTATVDRDGRFRIDDVPPGKYVLGMHFSQHAAGHLPEKVRFEVPPGDDLPHALPLKLGNLQLRASN